VDSYSDCLRIVAKWQRRINKQIGVSRCLHAGPPPQNPGVATRVSILEVSTPMAAVVEGMEAMPDEHTPEGEGPTRVWYSAIARVIVSWTLLTTLWIAYALYSRDIPLGARAWAVAFGLGFFVTVVRIAGSLLIVRDPPKSLSLRLLSHAGVIVLVCLTFAIWVLTLDWLEAAR
jgi:hypothetical protein